MNSILIDLAVHYGAPYAANTIISFFDRVVGYCTQPSSSKIDKFEESEITDSESALENRSIEHEIPEASLKPVKSLGEAKKTENIPPSDTLFDRVNLINQSRHKISESDSRIKKPLAVHKTDEKKVWKMEDIPPFEIKGDRIVFDPNQHICHKCPGSVDYVSSRDRIDQLLQVICEKKLMVQFVINQDCPWNIDSVNFAISLDRSEELFKFIEEIRMTRGGCTDRHEVKPILEKLGLKCPNLKCLSVDDSYSNTQFPQELSKLTSITFENITCGDVEFPTGSCLTALSIGEACWTNINISLEGLDKLECLSFGKVTNIANIKFPDDFPQLKTLEFTRENIGNKKILQKLEELKAKIESRNRN